MSFDIKFTRQGFENLFTLGGLSSDSTSDLKAEPGKLDIKRCEPGILFIILLQTSDNDVFIDFLCESMSLTTSFKKCNVIMTCREIANVNQVRVQQCS